MHINEFAKMSHERSLKYQPTSKGDWEFHLIGMVGECGELMNLLKKLKRGDFPMDEERKANIAEEVADAITYAFLALSELGVDPEKTILDKYEKVNKRVAKGGFHVRN